MEGAVKIQNAGQIKYKKCCAPTDGDSYEYAEVTKCGMKAVTEKHLIDCLKFRS